MILNKHGVNYELHFPNPEHFGSAHGAGIASSGPAVFHGYGFCVFHFTLSTTFHDASIFWLRVGLQNRVFLL